MQQGIAWRSRRDLKVCSKDFSVFNKIHIEENTYVHRIHQKFYTTGTLKGVVFRRYLDIRNVLLHNVLNDF